VKRPLLDPPIIDRAAERRDGAVLEQMDSVIVANGALLAAEGRLLMVRPADQPPAALRLYLGREGDRDIAALVPADPGFGQDGDGIGTERMVPLRDLFRLISLRGDEGARDRELASAAVALSTWHANHPCCSLCGKPTEARHGGWVRFCADCEREHYPRTDPAVIVAITDPEDRILLAHASYWSPRRFSHLAGYVEPGESLEQAVHREVFEEAHLRLRDLTYVGSQPWPFPASIMVGFTAVADNPAFTLDEDEISEAMWVSRDDLMQVIDEGTVIPAPRGSIARRMLEEWFGGTIPDGV
jgi:NAD+ diphosphatase